jgi:hypothetical protein
MSLPKPPLALWITTERERKGWKTEELSRRLTDLGCQASTNTVRVWEAPRGRPPRRSTVEVMERLFGSEAPVETADGDLAAAIREQAAAIDRLAAALERDREEAPVWAEAVVRAVLAGRQLSPADRERVER